MKKLLSITICLALFFLLASSLVMAEQTWSSTSVNFNETNKFYWPWGNANVPEKKFLDIYSATFTYFPSGGETIGRVDLAGRDVNQTVVWRLQAIYLEPKKPLHLTFPNGLRLSAGGVVEVSFIMEGAGSVYVDLNGKLNKK